MTITTVTTTILKPNLAVLIDAENISAVYIPMIMEKIAESYGNATVRRAYGDWTTPLLTGWKKVLEASALRPSQQFRHIKGKNTSDAALIMNAMELLHAREVNGFCIVSSDSDFTGLAGRIREKGLSVYGFGMRQTMRAFVAACDEFVYLDGGRWLATPRWTTSERWGTGMLDCVAAAWKGCMDPGSSPG